MSRQRAILRAISVVVAVTFLWTNCVWAGMINHLAMDSRDILSSVFRGFSVLKTPLVLHNAITAEGFSSLKELARELDNIKELLVGKGVLEKGEVEKYYAMTFRDEVGANAYYYFSRDGYFFRITNSIV